MITTTQRNPRMRSVGDSEVRAKTGFGWLDWQIKLDAWNAENRRLRATIAHLKEHYGLNQFWAQVVATHYLLERLREG
jgi:hypothetical protein